MNYLAHTFLSCKDANLLAGNFMADFIHHKEKANLKPEILLGIELHKRIDSFTDSHQDVKDTVRLLRPVQGKYTPVSVDIIFDYVLTQDWVRYSSQSLSVFKQNVYKLLIEQSHHYPIKVKQRMEMMIADDFLMSCATEERLIRTFERIKKRAKFDNNFENAHKDMYAHYDQLREHFHNFFPDLIIHVNEFCACN
ncbi:MAG: DUF479 domain-containing protein [Saprospiraceae bacterium]|nr:DUF479 domain-containing protein [Saprospiraceae bacterium]